MLQRAAEKRTLLEPYQHGLTLAADLASRGISFRVVDPLSEPVRDSFTFCGGMAWNFFATFYLSKRPRIACGVEEEIDEDSCGLQDLL